MVNTNSSDADWQRCVRERRYPPGVMPGTPQGKKFLGSIDIARAAREAVREAPRMPREVREKVWALLGTSRPSQPAPPTAREEPTPRPPARKKIDVEQDELLSAVPLMWQLRYQAVALMRIPCTPDGRTDVPSFEWPPPAAS